MLETSMSLYDRLFPDNDPVITLTYFNVPGIAQATRDTMLDSNIVFVDNRVSKETFEEIQPILPFGKLPVLEVDDDLIVAQSKTILRYVSSIAKTFPRKNLKNMAIVDQWLELHTEFMNPLLLSIYPQKYGLPCWSEESKASHRAWCNTTHIPTYLHFLELTLSDNEWLCTNVKSAADYAWLPTLKWLMDGTFDGVDATTFYPFPEVVSFVNRAFNTSFEGEDENTDETDDVGHATLDDEQSDLKAE